MRFDTIKKIRTKCDKINKWHSFNFFFQGQHVFQGWEERKEGGNVDGASLYTGRLHALHHGGGDEMHWKSPWMVVFNH